MNEEIPDGVPENIDQGVPVRVGIRPDLGLLVLVIGDGPDAKSAGLPVAMALQLSHNINGKCLQFLLQGLPEQRPDDEGGDGPRLVQP